MQLDLAFVLRAVSSLLSNNSAPWYCPDRERWTPSFVTEDDQALQIHQCDGSSPVWRVPEIFESGRDRAGETIRMGIEFAKWKTPGLV